MLVFDDIYINCKYQALINMMILFNKNKDDILYSFINKNEFAEKYNVYQVKYITFDTIEKILKKNGIMETKINYSDNIDSIFNQCMNNEEKCLIIRIDLFYTPYNLRYYKKRHYKRFILVHNITEKNATILDKDKNNIYTEYTKVPINDIKKWYNGYINTFYKTNIRNDETIYLYKLIDNTNNNLKYEDKKSILSNVIKKSNEIYEENLKILNQILYKIKNNIEFEFNKSLEKFLAEKKVERYRYSIFKDEILIDGIYKQEQIINEIRLEIFRNNDDSRECIIKKLKEYIKIEKDIYDTLIYLTGQK